MLDVSIAPEHIRETTDSIPNGKARSSSSSLIAKARRTTPIIPKIKVIMYILFYVKKFFILYGFDTKVIHEFIRICTTCIRYILCHFFHYTNFKSLGELRGFEPLSLQLYAAVSSSFFLGLIINSIKSLGIIVIFTFSVGRVVPTKQTQKHLFLSGIFQS